MLVAYVHTSFISEWTRGREPDGADVSARQRRFPHQELINRASALAALANGPDDERLTAAHVTGGEQSVA